MKISQVLVLLIILIICQLSLTQEVSEDSILESQVQALLKAENTENTDDVAETMLFRKKIFKKAVRKVLKKPKRIVKRIIKKPKRIVKKIIKKPKRIVKKIIKKPKRIVKRILKKPKRIVKKIIKKTKRVVKRIIKKPKRIVKRIIKKPKRIVKNVIAAAKRAAAAKKAKAIAAAKKRAAAAKKAAALRAAAAKKAKAAAAKRAAALKKAKAIAAAKAKAAAEARKHAKSYTCQATGDPHMVNFQRQPYENQFSGDLTLFQKPGYRCDTRQMRWNGGKNYVNGRIACQIGSQHIELFTPTDVRINGKKAPTGSKTIGGVAFKWNGANVEFSKDDTHVRVQILKTGTPTWYMNFYITTRGLHGVKGLCNGKYDSRTKGTKPPTASPSILDGKRHPVKRRTPIKYGKKAIKWATGICEKKGLKGEPLKDCIMDVAASHSKKVAADFLKAQQLRLKMKKKHALQRLAAAKAKAAAARARAAAARARAEAAKKREALRKAKLAAAAKARAAKLAAIAAARKKAEELRKAAAIAKAKELAEKRKAEGQTFNCYATGDPHMSNFDGQKYENQFSGDFNIFTRPGIKCHVRQEFWNPQHTVTVNTKLACKIAGDHIEAHGPNDVRLNGKKIKNGVHNLKSGTKLEFNGRQMTIHYAGSSVRTQINNGHAKGPLPSSYQNIYISTKGTKGLKGVTGLCNGNFDSRNKATKPPVAKPSLIDGKGIRVEKPHPAKKFGHKVVVWATGICRKRKLTGNALKDCIFDVAATHKKRFANAEKKLIDLRNRLKKKRAAAAKAKARAAAAKARAAAAKARAKAAALRKKAIAAAKAKAAAAKRKVEAEKKRKTYNCYSTGDPHMRNFHGKLYENQFAGVFQFFHKPGFKCDVRQSFWNVQKTITVNKRIACNVGRVHVELYGLNDLRINCKKHAKFNKKIGKVTISFDGRTLKITNKNGDNVRAQVSGTPSRFLLNLYATARGLKGTTGLCSGVYDSRKPGTKPPRAEPSIVDGKGVKLEKPKPTKLTKKALKWAEGICKARKLKGHFLKECIFDVAATHKKRFAEAEERAQRMRDKLKRHKDARARKLKRDREAAARRALRAKQLSKEKSKKKIAALKKQAAKAKAKAAALRKKAAKEAKKKAAKAKKAAQKAAKKAAKAAQKAKKAAKKANKKAALKKLKAARKAKEAAKKKLAKAKKLKKVAKALKKKTQTKSQQLKAALKAKKLKTQKLKLCYKTTSSNDYDVKKVAKAFKPTKSDEKNIIGKAM